MTTRPARMRWTSSELAARVDRLFPALPHGGVGR
jgi:hypothetical protein